MRFSEWNVLRRTTSLILLRIVCLLLLHSHYSVRGKVYTSVILIPLRLILPLSSYACVLSNPHESAIDPIDSMHATLPDADALDRLSVSDQTVTKDTDNHLIEKDHSKTPTKFPCDAGALSSSVGSGDAGGGISSNSSSGDCSGGGDDNRAASPMCSPSNSLRFAKVLLQHQ